MSQRMPVLFVGHGSPMNAITDNPYRASWQALGARLPRPQAILCVSAHWLTRGTAVTTGHPLETIHDFYGFPPALFAERYPVPDARAFAQMATEAIRSTRVAADTQWGLDHGAWAVLKPMYPAGDVPVFQLSIDATLPPRRHLEIGREIGALRERGVMIVASGNIVHNLATMRPGAAPYDWALEFDAYVASALERRDDDALVDYLRLGRPAELAVNSAEHYLPLLYAAGARDAGDELEFFNDTIDMASISMRSVVLSPV
ncbi:MAG: 4,5-DOPA dioxygenase extradiol [Burkholderiales bacterium]|jgi:4,5-DOPA dioxygenase extradiol|nr:4,5-DOPA dioxygenase extradiol [Burkholderiales bacterium]